MLSYRLNSDLIYACRVLFDMPARPTDDFLMSLEPAALKRAYRRKALETHPDRSMALGKSEAEMNRRFKEVSMAYERLIPIANGEVIIEPAPKPRPAPAKPSAPPRPDKKAKAWRFSAQDHYYQGVFPKRPLKFGQYLYYSNHISWMSLISAIIWQKKQRPLFGQIARNWGFLTADEIQYILTVKPYTEKIGEYALRAGYLTVFQHLAVLGKQRLQQPLIGQYFIQENILTAEKLAWMIEQAAAHNRRFRE